MIVSYDSSVDAIYFKLIDRKIHSTEPKTSKIIIDYDDQNNIVGIEVLDFQFLITKKGLTVNDLPFPEKLLGEASQYFNSPITV
ncbi:DUF2283 domain-containing protein [Cyanobacterium sp. IPPAS B-1200]|uniref:DUF2283 domain-containing protein n=1 Tax=Cyanobacterium sp. IPPAS B-1200 TaxID=1562720 RepID=UPI0008524B14|nr:DUF2283 domain-containing protein [Cyanobacterium sp. IPPAS B-1200]OEJ79493.1 hypothetical protein A5482_01165 [Cyanobacterium sp. IPPAS B-1200]